MNKAECVDCQQRLTHCTNSISAQADLDMLIAPDNVLFLTEKKNPDIFLIYSMKTYVVGTH